MSKTREKGKSSSRQREAPAIDPEDQKELDRVKKQYKKSIKVLGEEGPLVQPHFDALKDSLMHSYSIYEEMQNDIVAITAFGGSEKDMAKLCSEKKSRWLGSKSSPKPLSETQSQLSRALTVFTDSSKNFATAWFTATELIAQNRSYTDSHKMLRVLQKNEYVQQTLSFPSNNSFLLTEEQILYAIRSSSRRSKESVTYEHNPKESRKVELRSGSNYTIYKGFCSGVEVAIKEMTDVSDDRKEALRAQCTKLSEIRDINISLFLGAIFEEGEAPKVKFISEYGERGSLRDVLHSTKIEISFLKRLGLIKELISAVAVVHERNMIHLDINPTNITIDKNFTLKLGGFDRAIFDATNGPFHTKLVGTQTYVAPEIYLQKEKVYNFKCDVYAFGVTAFEILTGEVPYAAAIRDEVLELVSGPEIELAKFYKKTLEGNGKISSIPIHNDTYSDIFNLIGQCIEHDPDRRDVDLIQWRNTDILAPLIIDALGGGLNANVMNFWNSFNVTDDVRDPTTGFARSIPWDDFLVGFKKTYLSHMSDFKNATDREATVKERRQELLCLKHALGVAYAVGDVRVSLGAWQTFNYFFSPIILDFKGDMAQVLGWVRKLYENKWWFGFISVAGAEKKMKADNKQCFLVRGSSSTPNAYTLSYKDEGGATKHIRCPTKNLRDLLIFIDQTIKDSRKTMQCKFTLNDVCKGGPYEMIFGAHEFNIGGYVQSTGEPEEYFAMEPESIRNSVSNF